MTTNEERAKKIVPSITSFDSGVAEWLRGEIIQALDESNRMTIEDCIVALHDNEIWSMDDELRKLRPENR